MNHEPITPSPEDEPERPNLYADLGGGTDKGEAAREKIRRDIAERAARKQADQENSPGAQADKLRAEIARKLAAGQPIGKSREWYAEMAQMSVDEIAAQRHIRMNKTRELHELPPIEADPDQI